MKKIQIDYSQLLFLYAYLRLIDLSVDRSRWSSLVELQYYFKSIITPSQVIKYLNISLHLPETNLEYFAFNPEKKTIIDRLRCSIFKTYLLSQDEVLYCCKLLFDFEEILNSDNKTYNLDIEKLRIEIAKYYTEVLENVIWRRDLNRLMKVEHFGQNNKIDVYELNGFVPDDFFVKSNH